MNDSLPAIYDFELLPYALGDVLTWNVQTAIRCEQAGRKRVDVHVCADDRHPANLYQKDFVSTGNYGLYLSELLGAFGTHSLLGNLAVYRRREDLLARLRDSAARDAASAAALADYEQALAGRSSEEAVVAYFTRELHSHGRINDFARQQGRIPLLQPSIGCDPDITGLLGTRLAGKRVVVVHVRLRRLDSGQGGGHTTARDSDFLEWYDFLKAAGSRHPDVHFVVVGRLQEKPLELLKLPNVTNLRVLGLGLGHELALILRADLFIGTSSGFAAMANFSSVPYFITHVTPASCKAYGIEPGTPRLPFATDRQFLVYEPETSELLMRLLERGLADRPPRAGAPSRPHPAIDVRSWEWERSQWLYPDATTHRFFHEGAFADKETAFLLWPKIRQARAARRQGRPEDAWALLDRIAQHFPGLCDRFPEYLELRRRLALELGQSSIARECAMKLEVLAADDPLAARLRRLPHRLYPTLEWLKWAWSRKHRVPRKLFRLLKG